MSECYQNKGKSIYYYAKRNLFLCINSFDQRSCAIAQNIAKNATRTTTTTILTNYIFLVRLTVSSNQNPLLFHRILATLLYFEVLGIPMHGLTSRG